MKSNLNRWCFDARWLKYSNSVEIKTPCNWCWDIEMWVSLFSPVTAPDRADKMYGNTAGLSARRRGRCRQDTLYLSWWSFPHPEERRRDLNSKLGQMSGKVLQHRNWRYFHLVQPQESSLIFQESPLKKSFVKKLNSIFAVFQTDYSMAGRKCQRYVMIIM